jgi:hypothetical protein
MAYSVKSSDLANMSEPERGQVLGALVNAALHETEAGDALLRERIREFELRYEMSSDEMRAEYSQGKVRETAEIAQWLFLLETIDNYA